MRKSDLTRKEDSREVIELALEMRYMNESLRKIEAKQDRLSEEIVKNNAEIQMKLDKKFDKLTKEVEDVKDTYATKEELNRSLAPFKESASKIIWLVAGVIVIGLLTMLFASDFKP